MSAGARRVRLRRRRGVVLIVVLFVLLVVVAATLTLGRDARVELEVARARADEVQLQALVASAVDLALAELRRDDRPGDRLDEPWRDDEPRFRGAALGEGRIWLLLAEPDPGDGREVRWGVRDEASRLNLNAASREQLLALPVITEEAVDAILDWRDADDEVEPQGAEASYYGALTPAYRPKNGFFEALDELLRVRGIDEAMLYGEDRNRNGLLDPGEDDGDRSFPPDDADGQLDRGLIDYLTVFSRDPNRTRDGRARLDWNAATPQGVVERMEAAGLAPDVRERVLVVKATRPQLGSLGELIGRVGSSDPAVVSVLLDELGLGDAEYTPGRINVNTASREVLATIPGLSPEHLDAILSARLEAGSDLASPAWLLRVLSLAELTQVVDLVTTRSEQFTVQAVALLAGRRRFRRVEVLVDRTYAPVRVLTWRDLTGLGFPFPGERGEGSPK